MAEKKAAEKKKPELPKATFQVGEKKYKFIRPILKATGFNKNEAILAVDALKDPKLLTHLVKIGAGVIEEVEEGGK